MKAVILTISDTRTLTTDKSGQFIESILKQNDIEILQRKVVIDDTLQIQLGFLNLENLNPDIIITNGGTGIAQRDVSIKSLKPLMKKEITGFGELFRQISYNEIGTHSMASNAFAGINIKNQLCFSLPGSTNACKTALNQIILPELNHLIKEIRK